ncbi:hypothetical protein [Cupriavidus necator]|uniref:hypothetical protein n=1 Tax=Cupriavidus necator TaxID=106590 RepID=UPI00339DA2C9
MSNSDDLKPSGPPTLFGSEPDAGATGQTRILASLEGRVPMAAKTPPKKRARRYVGGGLVAVAAAAVAWAWFGLGPDGDAPLQAHSPATPAQAPAAAAPGAVAQAPGATAPTAASAVSAASTDPTKNAAENSQLQPATIVDIDGGDDALDSLGKMDGAGAAASAAGTTLAALTALGSSQPAAASRQVAPAAKAKTEESAKNNKKTTATAKALATAKTEAGVAGNSKVKKTAKSSSASKPAKGARRKGASSEDPDAEVLAALLSQPEGKPIASAASTRPTSKARN